MSDCCSSSCQSDAATKKHLCPSNKLEYKKVSSTTILHHIKSPWNWQTKDQSYYFCDDPECDVVYFSEDNTIIEKSNLRTTVGIKEHSLDAIICYCFGVTKATAINTPEVKKFVTEKTKEQICACEIRNPSGKCCLKDL